LCLRAKDYVAPGLALPQGFYGSRRHKDRKAQLRTNPGTSEYGGKASPQGSVADLFETLRLQAWITVEF